MKIGIQAADLDYDRIDGTRVYILNLLKYFGKIDSEDDFFVYHKGKFNPELTPEIFSNYKIKSIPFPFAWTQLRFCFQIGKDKIKRLWMPLHSIPLLKSKKIITTVTIHDLAFKYFPDHFRRVDLLKINLFTDWAVKYSDRIIAISNSTKADILKFYPNIPEDKIKVIYHGFDEDNFSGLGNPVKDEKIIKNFGIDKDYILYTGAIQPRKNLNDLIDAFAILKKKNINLRLVLAGERAWLSDGIMKKINGSHYAEDILVLGKVKFKELGALYRNAKVFVYPSLYEGFGIPILEAMASKVPVIVANNSSLPEVAGSAALYFDAKNPNDLAEKIESIASDNDMAQELVSKGLERIKKFSWENCARETLEYIKKD